MAGGITTFRARRSGVDPAVLAAALQHEGFTAEPAERISRTVLDTFDGRIAAAGLRLDLTTPVGPARRAVGGELVLRGGPGAPARVLVAGVPRIATDVPAGPLRFRLARLLDVRVLMSFVTVVTDRTIATRRNGTGKTTVVAVTYEGATAGDADLDELLVEVIELAGYAQPADDLRDALAEIGLRRAANDVVGIAASATGVDLHGCAVAPGVAIASDVPALDGFRAVLANLRDAIVANWDGTIADVDPEFLHDLRVAVRRTRSVLSNAKNVIGDDVRARSREEFGWFGEITGPTRDLDVYQIEWSTYIGPLAADALEPVRVHLDTQRQAEHELLSTELIAERATRTIDEWTAWLDDPAVDDDKADGADRPIGELIAKRVRRAHRTMVDRGRTITPDTHAAVLHELRKDAKKMRYLLECFGGLYEPAARKAFVRRLKALQDNLGEHQDAEVHVVHLRELADTLAPKSTTETVLATGQLIERMEQRRIASRDEFAERFAAFDSSKTADALAALLASVSDAASP